MGGQTPKPRVGVEAVVLAAGCGAPGEHRLLGAAHRPARLLLPHRTEDVVDGAEPHHLSGVVRLAVGADDDQPRGRLALQQPLRDLQAAHARHADVGEQDLADGRFDAGQRLAAARSRVDPEAPPRAPRDLIPESAASVL